MLSFWKRLPLVANLQTFNTLPTTSIASRKILKQHNFPFHTSAQEPKTNTMTHIPESFGNFDLVKKLKLDFTDVLVSKWRSRRTGLTIIHLDYNAPIVHGYFVVATEIFDDSGCPHTLEHLVFMGSEKYPYKGMLDLFANRGFSQGTNAWTATDHTAYTVSTAGEQGFLQLLPIYVDHILFPTITNASFVTEVHHVDPTGQDAGVVYSEMQGRENTSDDLMLLGLQRLLEPPGSGYRSETGGVMDALRVLTPEQIRKYHSNYYVPHNLALIVAGKFSSGTSSLLRVVQEQIEPSLISHGLNRGPYPSGWKRPFVETASALRNPIPTTTKHTVEFPEKDESMGELIINFLGPSPNEHLTRKAIDVLGTYLTSSATAPLNKEFVEIGSPLCSYIYFDEVARVTAVNLPIYIGSVPTRELPSFNEKLQTSLRRIVKEGIDMHRMTMVINRDERQMRSQLESSKGDAFSSTVISDFLYGAMDGSDLHSSMDEINHYATLRSWSSQKWTNLLSQYYIEPASIVICGHPSASMADKLEKNEKARIAAQVERLGPEGLKKAEVELEAAKAEHGKAVPTDIITSFPVPDVKSISWLSVQSVQEPGIGRKLVHRASASSPLSKYIDSDGKLLPFFVEYDHVESDFVSVHGFFSLAKLPNHLRPYITAYLSSFFSLPVRRASGVMLSHEEVVNQLDNETVAYTVGLGVSNFFTDIFRVSIQVETAQYETAVAWLKDLVYGADFNRDRLQVVLAKIQQSLPQLKRSGSKVLGSLWHSLIYDDSSTSRAAGVLPQAEFIPKLSKSLQESPGDVIADFEEIRKYITDPSGIRFSVTGNILKLANPRSTWGKYFTSALPSSVLSPVPLASETLSDVGQNTSKKAIVMSLPTIESSFVNHTSKGIRGFDHPEYPAIRVALEVFNATEGYLWRYIRGSGLAYGAYMSLDVEAGLLSFDLSRSSNSLKAFETAVTVVRGLLDGSIEFDDTVLDATKSSIVYQVTRGVCTSEKAAMVSFSNQALKNVPRTYEIDLLEKYQAVTKDDVLSAIKTYFLPLFDSSSSVAVVVTAPAKADEIGAGLEAIGFEVTQRVMETDPTDSEDSIHSEDDETDSGASSDSM